MLDNAWKGYNCSLFAYGQTGSGKSYSMVGYKANKGVCVCVRVCVSLDATRSSCEASLTNEHYNYFCTNFYFVVLVVLHENLLLYFL